MNTEKYHRQSSERRHKGPNILMPLLILLGGVLASTYAANIFNNASTAEYVDIVLKNIDTDTVLTKERDDAILPGTQYPVMYADDRMGCEVDVFDGIVQILPTDKVDYTIVDLGKTGGVLQIRNPLIFTSRLKEKYFMITLRDKGLNHPVFVPIKKSTIQPQVGCADGLKLFILSEYYTPERVFNDNRIKNRGNLNQMVGYVIEPLTGRRLTDLFPASIGTYFPEKSR